MEATASTLQNTTLLQPAKRPRVAIAAAHCATRACVMQQSDNPRDAVNHEKKQAQQHKRQASCPSELDGRNHSNNQTVLSQAPFSGLLGAQEKRTDAAPAATTTFLPSRGSAGLWRVTEHCRILYQDTSLAHGNDLGMDNLHNTRNAQSTFCQEAYRSDRAHPADYTRANKRLSGEARDLLVAIMCRVATQIAAAKDVSGTKVPDPLDPRSTANLGVAIQLFDRFMAIVQRSDASEAEPNDATGPLHPLRGLGGRKGLSPLLLNQLIAIACLCFAERFEAIAPLEYRHVVAAWRQQAAGMMRSAWPTRPSFNVKAKLLHLERVILAHVTPCGLLALPPTSELTESLMNTAYLFATCKMHKESGGSYAAHALEACRSVRAQNVNGLDAMVPQNEQGGSSNGQSRLNEVSILSSTCQKEFNPFMLVAAEPEGCFSLRISGSARIDVPRQLAQLLVRLAELDRGICLRFRPSTVAAAAAQLAIFPTSMSVAACALAPKEAKAVEAAFAAAASAVTASGGSSSCRLVRQCQLLLIQKWIKVKNAILTKTEEGGSLPDRLLAVWVQENLCKRHHQRVLIALQQHANGLLRCAALARRHAQKGVSVTQGGVPASSDVKGGTFSANTTGESQQQLSLLKKKRSLQTHSPPLKCLGNEVLVSSAAGSLGRFIGRRC